MKGLIIGLSLLVGLFSSVQALSDIHLSKFPQAVTDLSNKGIVKGYNDGSFQPGRLINRAEFLKIIMSANYAGELQNESLVQKCFADIEVAEEWYVPYACLAKQKNIINGRQGKFLDPSAPIRFVEAAKIITKVYSPLTLSEPNVWYQPYVEYLLEQNMIPVDHVGAFDQELTREMVSEMIFRALLKEEQVLIPYLELRRDRYGEDFFPNFSLFTKKVEGKPLNSAELGSTTLTVTVNQKIPREKSNITRYPDYNRIITSDHPGDRVEGNFISTYSEWTEANYLPGLNNNNLSANEELKLRHNLSQLINDERKLESREKLTENEKLNEMAQNFAEHLVINAFYSHMDKYGRKPNERAEFFGYEGRLAESMSWQSANEVTAMEWWKGSEVHRANIFDARFSNIGVGVAKEPNGRFVFVVLTGE